MLGVQVLVHDLHQVELASLEGNGHSLVAAGWRLDVLIGFCTQVPVVVQPGFCEDGYVYLVLFQ